MQKFKTGETAPKSGMYRAYDSKGKPADHPTYMEKGEHFPPTQHDDAYWTEDRQNTKHQGRGK